MKFPWIWLAASGLAVAGELKEETVHYAGAGFRVVEIEVEKVRVVWKDKEGRPFATFDRVQEHFAARGKPVKFLMNAGIYEPGGVPSGLHVEEGRELRPLNVEDGEGNFFLKPNGVVAASADGSGFIGTPEAWGLWRKKQRPQGDRSGIGFAVQSGPLLLIDGKRHPAFREGSPNKLHRNGVGYDKGKRRFVFVITAKGESVNLWDFAGLFLKLGCKDALFLDGDISQMAMNPKEPMESNRFGAIFVVTD